MKKLRHQTFRSTYVVAGSGDNFQERIDKAIKVAQDDILRMVDDYLPYGLMDDKNWRERVDVGLRPLGGPFHDFKITRIEDWCNQWEEGLFTTRGEECIRIWFTTNEKETP